MSGWYVIQTKPQKEGVVSTLLKNAGYEVFLPKVKSMKRGVVPLFPLYIFVRTDLNEARHHRNVKFTRGVNKILGTYDGRPYPIEDEIVEMIQERVGSNEVLEFNQLTAGREVIISRGPFKDLEGVLERPMTASGRVAVLLNIYGRTVRMTAHAKDIAVA